MRRILLAVRAYAAVCQFGTIHYPGLHHECLPQAEKNRGPETRGPASHRRHRRQFRLRIGQGAGQTCIIRRRGRVRIDGRRPLLFHLRNSDSVCQYADTVLIAHRPGLYNDKTDPNETELILAKHPWLSPCTFNLMLKPEYSKFTDQ